MVLPNLWKDGVERGSDLTVPVSTISSHNLRCDKQTLDSEKFKNRFMSWCRFGLPIVLCGGKGILSVSLAFHL